MADLAHIVVHHSASPRHSTVDDVRRWHRARGWRDIGYHWLIRQPKTELRATTYMGRRHNLDAEWESWEYGAHSRGENTTSVGICLIGNFDNEAPPEDMWRALVDQCVLLCTTFHLEADAIQGHRDMPGANTACPGEFIDLAGLRAEVAGILA